jgi:hypothetical protein
VDLSLHHHLVLPLAVPLARGDRGDVWCRALDPVLEVVTTDRPRVKTSGVQHMVEPKEAHICLHAYVHLIEMHEDHHQGDRVW